MPALDATSCKQFARLMGTPKAPVILDVRREAERAGGPRLLPGARPLAEADLSPEGLARIAGAAGLGLALHLTGLA